MLFFIFCYLNIFLVYPFMHVLFFHIQHMRMLHHEQHRVFE